MRIKKLVGKKCYLSPIDLDDAEQYAVWLNDQEVVEYTACSSSVISLSAEKEILAKLAKEHTYGIADLKTDKLLGNIGLMDINFLHRTAEVGLFIGEKSKWDKGYGSEALSLIVDYGFKVLNLHNIMLRVYSPNERAIKCYEKTGFKKAGVIRKGFTKGLKKYDIVLMDILPKDFYKT